MISLCDNNINGSYSVVLVNLLPQLNVVCLLVVMFKSFDEFL